MCPKVFAGGLGSVVSIVLLPGSLDAASAGEILTSTTLQPAQPSQYVTFGPNGQITSITVDPVSGGQS